MKYFGLDINAWYGKFVNKNTTYKSITAYSKLTSTYGVGSAHSLTQFGNISVRCLTLQAHAFGFGAQAKMKCQFPPSAHIVHI